MSIRLKFFISIIFLISFSTYFIYKIYELSALIYIVPFLVLLPIAVIFLTRGERKGVLDIVLGHYLFYLNYIICFFLFLFIISLDTLAIL